MHTIKLGNTEYNLRFDLNVAEKIFKKYGGEKIPFDVISDMKEVAAMMINEYFYYVGSNSHVTPDFIGANLQLSDYADLCTVVMATINDGMTRKN